MRIFKNQPIGTSFHLAGFWPGGRGDNSTISVLKQADFCRTDSPKFYPDFPKNSGWIKKPYQRISSFGKSHRPNPLSGTVPDDVSAQQIRWEKDIERNNID
jgi:hypothetical protein